jgi:putative glutamine amidotransferase
MMKQKSIAVSKLAPKYEAWLQKLCPGLEIVNFDGRDPGDFRSRVQQYSGLVLTGGGDIHPSLYGNPDTEHYCQGIDIRRDELEFSMLEAALTCDLPILAICRGLQVLNVFLGGTLIPHIPAIPGKLRHKDQLDVNHGVSINPDSQLFRISGTHNEIVNSSHHQAIEKPGSGLLITAFSEDGIAEAAELRDHNRRFCVAVQWHPERMEVENPLSGRVGLAFINEVGKNYE